MDAALFLASFISLTSGFAAGLLAGLFGVGGGTLVVPILMLLGASIHQATALSLIYIFFTSLSGSLSYWKQQQILTSLTLVLSGSAAVSALLGVHLGELIPASGIAWLFVIFMALVLLSFALKNQLRTRSQTLESPNQSYYLSSRRLLTGIATGLLAGLLASLLGVGGGLIMVPMLVLFCGLDLKQATGTSLASVCLIALVGVMEHGFVGQLIPGLQKLGLPLLLMCLSGIAAAPVGVRLNRSLPEKWLKLGFVVLCLAVMAFMGLQTRS
jgi:uncharacterized membrane protein YfcA